MIQVALWAGLTLRAEFGRSFTKNPRGVVKVYNTPLTCSTASGLCTANTATVQKVVRAIAQAISPASYLGGRGSILRQSARDLWWTVAMRKTVRKTKTEMA